MTTTESTATTKRTRTATMKRKTTTNRTACWDTLRHPWLAEYSLNHTLKNLKVLELSKSAHSLYINHGTPFCRTNSYFDTGIQGWCSWLMLTAPLPNIDWQTEARFPEFWWTTAILKPTIQHEFWWTTAIPKPTIHYTKTDNTACMVGIGLVIYWYVWSGLS